MPDLFSEQIYNSCGFALLSPLQDRIAYSKVPSLFLYVFAVVAVSPILQLLIQIKTLKK